MGSGEEDGSDQMQSKCNQRLKGGRLLGLPLLPPWVLRRPLCTVGTAPATSLGRCEKAGSSGQSETSKQAGAKRSEQMSEGSLPGTQWSGSRRTARSLGKRNSDFPDLGVLPQSGATRRAGRTAAEPGSIQNISNLQRLIFLDLYDNQIEEISGLSTLRSLRVLLLGKNR